MKKREYCESHESIAYYSGLNGLEIKGIEYGIEDYIYCVSGAWVAEKVFTVAKFTIPQTKEKAHSSRCTATECRLMSASERTYNKIAETGETPVHAKRPTRVDKAGQKGKCKMKTIKDYNGNKIDFEAAVMLMDDEIREQLHGMGIEDEQELYNAYCEKHYEKYNEEFEI